MLPLQAHCLGLLPFSSHHEYAKLGLILLSGVRGYMLDIRVDDLDPIAEATFSSHLRDSCDADWQRLIANWQDLYVNPRTPPPSKLCTYLTRPIGIHSETIFRLALLHRCIKAILKFKTGCHNLPRDMGRRTEVSSLEILGHRGFAHSYHIGQPGDIYHLVSVLAAHS